MTDTEETEYVTCPFCKTKDFDLIGLKYHLTVGYCDEYNEVEDA